MDATKLEDIISGYGINADDAAWLRALPLEQREAEPRAVPKSARGHVDDGCKQIVSAMQSMRDRLGGFLAKTYGDQFDGDIDTMLEAINFMKALRVEAHPAPVAVPGALLEIGRRLATDRKSNDHHTADPIYTVQRELRIYGLDADYAERFAWLEDSEMCSSDLSERLERRLNRGWAIPDRYKRVGYCTRWEFVDAYLSYDAAKERSDYESRKHSGTYRTYVESGCRNHEWKAMQTWLIEAAKG